MRINQKLIAGLVAVIVSLSSVAPAFAAESLFFSGFESQSFADWSAPSGANFSLSGGTCRLGPDSNTAAVKITGATTPHSQILQKSVSTVGYENISLSFCYKWDALETGDGVTVEYTTDGATWTPIKLIDDSNTVHMMYAADDTEIATENGGVIPTPIPTTLAQLATYDITLPVAASNNPSFAFRVREDLGDGDDYVWMDDFRVSGTPVSSTPPAPNLILNPSVENGSATPTQWKTGKWGTNTTAFSYPVAGFDGSRAVRVEMTAHTSGDAKWYFDDVTVTPGTSYTFSDTYTANVSTDLVVRYTMTGGSNQYAFLATLPAAATPTLGEATFTAPAGAVSATVFHVIRSVGTLTTDGFSMRAN
jgi:hypothetical protein